MIPCPVCKTTSSWVVDKRNGEGFVRRRRQCDDCGERFTTREVVVASKKAEHDKARSLDRRYGAPA
jgi:transcriptional regulator NrdR family protein